MTFKVQLQSSGEEFVCDSEKSILQAALDVGIAIPFSCRSGMCMTCRAQVVKGSVSFGGAHEKYLSLEDREKGYALLCCAKPLTDIVVDVPKVSTKIASQKYPVRVLQIQKMSDDVMSLTLGLPPNQPVHFQAGQFVDFLLDGGVRRSYSIATAPKAQGVRQLEFHIRHLPGGHFTPHVFSNMKVRDLLQIEMPLGSFYLKEDSVGPMILLASGTGFAPIKSILTTLAERNSLRSIHLYWGGRQKQDLYDMEFVESLGSKLKNFEFIPVLSDALPSDKWSGRTGFVHRAVMQDFPDMSSIEVYACGAPIVVESARADFIEQCKLNHDQFYADSFVTEAEKSASQSEK